MRTTPSKIILDLPQEVKGSLPQKPLREGFNVQTIDPNKPRGVNFIESAGKK